MATDLSRVTSTLADRYRIERELGAGGTEPRWASDSKLVFLSQYRAAGVIAASVYRARVPSDARSPVGRPALIVRDPRFADTPGWSLATTPGTTT